MLVLVYNLHLMCNLEVDKKKKKKQKIKFMEKNFLDVVSV